MIVQFSTGGRGRDPAARGLPLVHRPDMASLSTGSTNFPTIVYENPAALVFDLATQMKQFEIAPEIEIFDLSHIHGAKQLIDIGLVSPRPHVQFVMGVQNALPANEHLSNILLAETRRVIPGATWTAAGIGRHQSLVMQWALERGADAVRTGMEDNIRIAKDRLASGNDELVHFAVGLLERFGCRPATPRPRHGALLVFDRPSETLVGGMVRLAIWCTICSYCRRYMSPTGHPMVLSQSRFQRVPFFLVQDLPTSPNGGGIIGHQRANFAVSTACFCGESHSFTIASSI